MDGVVVVEVIRVSPVQWWVCAARGHFGLGGSYGVWIPAAPPRALRLQWPGKWLLRVAIAVFFSRGPGKVVAVKNRYPPPPLVNHGDRITAGVGTGGATFCAGLVICGKFSSSGCFGMYPVHSRRCGFFFSTLEGKWRGRLLRGLSTTNGLCRYGLAVRRRRRYFFLRRFFLVDLCRPLLLASNVSKCI